MKETRIDDFATADGWQAFASGEAMMKVTAEAGALRLDFDFHGGGGFVVARKEFRFAIPDDYAFAFRVRGAAPQNTFEFKLTDPSGRNVWRWQEPAFAFGRQARELDLRGSRIGFAWGPAGGGTPEELGAIEFVLSAGPGGKGTVWIEDLRFQDRTIRRKPAASATSSVRGCEPGSILGAKGSWRAAAKDAAPVLALDFHEVREYGGLVIDWEPKPAARAFRVQASADGVKWRTLHRAKEARGARSFIPLPGGESRQLRLAFDTPGVGIRRIAVKPFEFSRSTIDFFHQIAAASPRGRFPRYLSREQSYWTSAGVPDGLSCALINEEGLVEPFKGGFTLEPFLHDGRKLHTWADARRTVTLEDGELPIPSARWDLTGWALQTTVCGRGEGADAVILTRHRVSNKSAAARKVTLFIAIRPFQVTPPWQGWQGLGGMSEIREIAWKKDRVVVNRERTVVPLIRPDGFGAASFEQGSIPTYLAAGELPPQTAARDAAACASAALRFDLTIPAGGSCEVFLALPSGQGVVPADGATAFDEALREMRTRLAGVTFDLPAGPAREAARTFKTAAGQILIQRDGAALQPGPRRYTRSWIRDGVIMGAALLRNGDLRALPDFIRWYAPHQRKDGFVPCCVDRTGPDWLVEHDSHGQLIYGVAESHRFTGDRDFLRELWPRVRKAAKFLVKLRAQRLTAEYGEPDQAKRFGLLPESASHEGYLAHPVHSYWDDFWGLRGLLDAAEIATALGKRADAEFFAEQALYFRATLHASILAVIEAKGLNYIPGSVEWADFDPTATSNAISLLQALDDLPRGPLDAMFDRFVHDFRRKHSGAMEWNHYSAYEIRIIGALVRLGKRAEANDLLETFLADRRPLRWNQWPEISWRDPRSPGHLGDVPHTWIAAEFMLAFASLFVFEREADDALVLAAGVPLTWLAGGKDVAVKGLRTWHGALDLSIRLDGELVLELGGALRVPAGGLVLRPPCPGSIRSVTVNGRALKTFAADEVRVHQLPATVRMAFETGSAEAWARDGVDQTGARP
jgi:hypothetical protein